MGVEHVRPERLALDETVRPIKTMRCSKELDAARLEREAAHAALPRIPDRVLEQRRADARPAPSGVGAHALELFMAVGQRGERHRADQCAIEVGAPQPHARHAQRGEIERVLTLGRGHGCHVVEVCLQKAPQCVIVEVGAADLHSHAFSEARP